MQPVISVQRTLRWWMMAVTAVGALLYAAAAGADDKVNDKVELPRYKLEVGQELSYVAETSSKALTVAQGDQQIFARGVFAPERLQPSRVEIPGGALALDGQQLLAARRHAHLDPARRRLAAGDLGHHFAVRQRHARDPARL